MPSKADQYAVQSEKVLMVGRVVSYRVGVADRVLHVGRGAYRVDVGACTCFSRVI